MGMMCFSCDVGGKALKHNFPKSDPFVCSKTKHHSFIATRRWINHYIQDEIFLCCCLWNSQQLVCGVSHSFLWEAAGCSWLPERQAGGLALDGGWEALLMSEGCVSISTGQLSVWCRCKNRWLCCITTGTSVVQINLQICLAQWNKKATATLIQAKLCVITLKCSICRFLVPESKLSFLWDKYWIFEKMVSNLLCVFVESH